MSGDLDPGGPAELASARLTSLGPASLGPASLGPASVGPASPGPASLGLTESLAGRARWAAIVVFAAVTAAGAIWLNPSAPVAVAGAVVAVGGAVPLVLGWRPVLLYAAIATAGIAMLGHGMSSNLGWFGVCLLTGWCVLAGSRREALAYWAGTMLLFAAEWLWVQPDPGWGAWLAGVTLATAFSLLIRHDRDLLRRLRQAQAGLAEQARAQERNRIARELHDVIGHTLTVSLLHVQSARLAVEHDPATPGTPWPRPNGSAASAWPRCAPRSGCSARTTPRTVSLRCRARVACPRWWSSSARRART